MPRGGTATFKFYEGRDILGHSLVQAKKSSAKLSR